MIESMKRWTIDRPDENSVQQLMKELNIPSMHAKILASRGITDPVAAKAFLYMDETSMHDPYLLHDMDIAVSMIQKKIETNEKIAIFGDYDADGVTSISVLKTALERLGADVFFAIPDRFLHGYGPNKELFLELYEQGASLIITVDNGISGIDEVAYAKSLGMDVIVTDHHEMGEVLPAADAIIHPRHPEGSYPFEELAGVGVAFKLACALLEDVPLDLLEFVAIGTVADLVPLRDENRYFVKEGLRRLRLSHRPGIRALIGVSSTVQSELTEDTIGFTMGPRLNAAGRLGDASPAVDLLTTDDAATASMLAEELDGLNKERQAIVKMITEEADQMITTLYGENIPHVLVIAGEGWNAGVVGIVASRLTDKYYRPSIVLSIDPETGMAKGSARSIAGFDLFGELSKNAQLLPHFGGHQMAAGLSLAINDIDQLRDNLIRQAEEVLTDDMLIPELLIDVPLAIDEIDVSVLESLELLRPFGMAFDKPTFMIEEVKAESIRKIGASKNHLKLTLADLSNSLDTIGFGIGHLADQLTPDVKFSVIGDLQVNEWNGHKKPQLLLKDIRTDEWQLFDLRGMREPMRWLPIIPEKKTAFIAFREASVHHFQTMLKGIAIHLAEPGLIPNADHIVLLDMPHSKGQLEQLVGQMNPKRVYAHFYVPDSMYFDGLPDRSQFGWFYSFLKNRGSFDAGTHSAQLAKHKGWKVETVQFMSQVFSELGFVKMENGLVSMIETAAKRDLSEAPTYQRRVQQMELEQQLLYAPYIELKRLLSSARSEAVDREETGVWI
ncbi:single-stranded-DNA-specific exonuclease RecJ [Sporosarcina sp. HYO08]|uniref:single-stranded-DNA-specific exonuclease RecJ n=1 Tax=Sporosarcina sp. HYO08 TaxID=1759557 RepID=UPI00079ADD32|nr:single-stranded-DNA-specific exonuclease RecJ [Sporosarcina sp. HYO08]KXH87570.1 single-stranded-DNA-specific exonuclease RecJ [Sporosarcina sp. HYO08]